MVHGRTFWARGYCVSTVGLDELMAVICVSIILIEVIKISKILGSDSFFIHCLIWVKEEKSFSKFKVGRSTFKFFLRISW